MIIKLISVSIFPMELILKLVILSMFVTRVTKGSAIDSLYYAIVATFGDDVELLRVLWPLLRVTVYAIECVSVLA